ncbi:sigma-70 family RNA polymerase sigma factor [Nocardia sp. CA-119907]|uniref:sigma-70 family RNA polymerase sigma factor n=1 Tax=Nocardia sp. CA-119907 TaxID=3239973 RepID=UPI003D97A99F
MVSALLADLFESNRAHLLSVAYRLTGSARDAEDAVQESWLRLAGAHQSEIEDLRAWLTTVVGRICLDHLRSAAVRRESYVGQWLPEPVVTGITPSSTPDPLEAVVRKQECSLAAMVVLESLTPPQRVAFVLHDGLSVPFGEIAEILGVSVEVARQLAVRARKSVAQAPPPTPNGEHAAAVRKFLDALSAGDIGAVTAALHPDSVLIGDANGTTSTAVNVIGGADKVARFFLGLVRKYGLDGSAEPTLEYEFASVNGQLGLVVHRVAPGYGRLEGPARVLGFAVRDGLVCGAYDLANPEKLSRVRLG